MPSKVCGFCQKEVADLEETCPVCGFRFVERPVKDKVELTDEQIAALAGFAEASIAQKDRAGQRQPGKLEKMGKNFLIWVVLPTIALGIAQKLHLIPNIPNPMAGAQTDSSKKVLDSFSEKDGK